MGRVTYIPYGSASIPEGPRAPFEYKRASLAHEREVRAMIQYPTAPENYPIAERGLSIPVNLEHLIVDVYVAPQINFLGAGCDSRLAEPLRPGSLFEALLNR
jgi:hypothetical protein